jgi:hypothetical protein
MAIASNPYPLEPARALENVQTDLRFCRREGGAIVVRMQTLCNMAGIGLDAIDSENPTSAYELIALSYDGNQKPDLRLPAKIAHQLYQEKGPFAPTELATRLLADEIFSKGLRGNSGEKARLAYKTALDVQKAAKEISAGFDVKTLPKLRM